VCEPIGRCRYRKPNVEQSKDIAQSIKTLLFVEKPVISFDSSVKQKVEVPASATLRLIASISVS